MDGTAIRDLNAEELQKRVLAEMPDRVDLVYVSQGDRFSEEQMQRLIRDDDFDDLVNPDWLYENEMGAVDYIVRQILDDEEAALLQSDHGLMEAVIEQARMRDESDYISDLFRGSPNVLLRYKLGDEYGDGWLDPGSYTWDAKEVREAGQALARAAGIRWRKNRTALEELVVNATYGGQLYVIWYGDAGDLYEGLRYRDKEGKPNGRIRWTNPYLLVLDSMNGSGHDVRIEGTISKPFDRERLMLDSQGWGYSWDAVCGLHGPAYDCDWSVKPR